MRRRQLLLPILENDDRLVNGRYLVTYLYDPNNRSCLMYNMGSTYLVDNYFNCKPYPTQVNSLVLSAQESKVTVKPLYIESSYRHYDYWFYVLDLQDPLNPGASLSCSNPSNIIENGASNNFVKAFEIYDYTVANLSCLVLGPKDYKSSSHSYTKEASITLSLKEGSKTLKSWTITSPK